jgi:hypothetical protein
MHNPATDCHSQPVFVHDNSERGGFSGLDGVKTAMSGLFLIKHQPSSRQLERP